jgi:hypothetical protein
MSGSYIQQQWKPGFGLIVEFDIRSDERPLTGAEVDCLADVVEAVEGYIAKIKQQHEDETT